MREFVRRFRWPDAIRPRRGSLSALPALLLLVVAFICGGSSANQPLRDMIVQLLAIVLLAATALGWIGNRFSADARIPMILIAALAALFAFQLVPLPGSLWAALSGRELDQSVLKLIGEPVGMRPLSLQPELTVLSALAVLPGVAMCVMAMRLDRDARRIVAYSLIVLAGISLLLGAAQASLGSEAARLTLYRTSHVGLPLGVFANANHQADLLLIGFLMAGLLRPTVDRWGPGGWWAYGIMAALAIGVIATGSRAGIALLGVAFIVTIFRDRLAGHTRVFLVGVVGLAAGTLLLVAFNPVFYRSFADFSNIDDGRFDFWPNVTYAIGQYGWLGTGAGTFDGVYRSVETLETLSDLYVNHAHNDYLEILLEMGAPGILLVLAFLCFFVWRGIAIVRGSEMPEGYALAYGGLAAVAILLLHSAVDYPLRTPLLSVVFGFCVALATRPPAGPGAERTEPNPLLDGRT